MTISTPQESPADLTRPASGEASSLPSGSHISMLLSAYGGLEAVSRIASAICRAENGLNVALAPMPSPGWDENTARFLTADQIVVMMDAEREAAPLSLPRLRTLFRDFSTLRFFAAIPVIGDDSLSSGSLQLGSLFLGDAQTPRALNIVQKNALLALGRHIGALLSLELHKRRLEAETVRLSALATTDGLTGLANRRSFNDRLQAAVTYARQTETSLSLVILDVDRFKSYNDMYGHPAGDEVLRQVGRILARTVRDSDMPARYGGEEFAVLLPETDGETAAIIADLLRSAIESHAWAQREVTASFGVAELKTMTRSGSELVSAADAALYLSKENGRNQVTVAE